LSSSLATSVSLGPPSCCTNSPRSRAFNCSPDSFAAGAAAASDSSHPPAASAFESVSAAPEHHLLSSLSRAAGVLASVFTAFL
ncbi:hypothetical protein PMAYCL1PPCAC_10193, partial [Pristionchus mayeri]